MNNLVCNRIVFEIQSFRVQISAGMLRIEVIYSLNTILYFYLFFFFIFYSFMFVDNMNLWFLTVEMLG